MELNCSVILRLWFGMHFLTKFAPLTEKMETFRSSSGNYGCIRLIVLRNKNVKKVCYKSVLSWFLDSYIATGILLFKADFFLLFVDEYQNSVVLELIPSDAYSSLKWGQSNASLISKADFSNFNSVNTFFFRFLASCQILTWMLVVYVYFDTTPNKVRACSIDCIPE